MRRLASLLACVASAAGFLSQSSLAQSKPQASAQVMTAGELRLLMMSSSFTACDLAANKTPWELSVASPSRIVTQIITDIYGGRPPGAAQVIQPEALFRVISTDIAINTLSLCPKFVPSESKAQLQKVIDARKSSPK